MRLCLAGFLTVHAVTDVWEGYIWLPVVWVQMAVGVLAAVWNGGVSEALLVRLLPGISVFMASILSGEKIGRGDAWLLMATGLYLDVWQQLYLWCCASVLAFLWTTGHMVAGRVDKTTQIALAPFVWFGYLGRWYSGWF